MLSPLTTQEAVLSSRIEGPQATLGEVLEFEAQGDLFDESTSKKADIREVLNYRAALNEAIRLLDELPLSQRLVRETHKALMQGVRGHNKAPGEYRRIANWIGPAGCTMETARFIPCPADKLAQAMNAWELYLHADAPDRLVQLAILHAEFEAIHPFLDGNGRLGRLIVPIFLFSYKLLSRPNFYLSAYLSIIATSITSACSPCRAIATGPAGANSSCARSWRRPRKTERKAEAILTLYRTRKDWIVEVTRSQHAVRALDWMFRRPTFTTSDFVRSSGIPTRTAHRILWAVRVERPSYGGSAICR